MDVKCINLFLEAFSKTLGQFGVTDVKRGNMKKKTNFYVDLDVSTIIVLRGGIQGNIALSMSQDTAKSLVSAMTNGMSVSSFDDTAKSAIGELTSIIAGTASTMCASSGITFNISHPVVLLGFSNVNSPETLAIDFETQLGKIEFNIGFNE